jgi:hypothetical protein
VSKFTRKSFLVGLGGLAVGAGVAGREILGDQPASPTLREEKAFAASDKGRRWKPQITPPAIAIADMPTNVRIHGPLRTWPASFFTGPLGTENILPTGPGAFFGMMTSAPGLSKLGERTRWNSWEASMGRVLDIRGSHYDGSLSNIWGGVAGAPDPLGAAMAPGGITQEQEALNRGSICTVTWCPSYTIAQMNAGAADAIWAKFATYLATRKPQKIMLRPFHEFDISPPTYTVVNSSQQQVVPSADFRAAWQRMVGIFQANGATNVGFWFVPTEGGGPGGGAGRTMIAECYPGDAYVDWVGSDAYNRVFYQSCPLHAGWADWWELFNYGINGGGSIPHWSLYDILSRSPGDPDRAVPGTRGLASNVVLRTKPFVAGETSTIYDGAAPNRKANWFREITTDSRSLPSLPHFIGNSFYDSNSSSVSGDFDWELDSNADAIQEDGSQDSVTRQGVVDAANHVRFKGR